MIKQSKGSVLQKKVGLTELIFRTGMSKKGEPGVEVVVAGSHELIFGWIIVFRPLQTLPRFYTFSI